jgi:putative ABC transport system substrate-binding protein
MKFAGALAVSFVLGLIIASRAAEAQQAPMYRIGVLATANPRSTVFYRAFEQRLRELGYEEGRNVVFEYRDAEGRPERLPALASELVRLNVDAIVVATDPATHAAKEATKTIPILIAGVNYDPVALKYVASLARPGGNVTGVFFLFRELTAKRLELFRELLPAVGRVAVLTDSFTTDQLRTVETGNRSLGLKLQSLSLRSPPDFEDSVRIAVRSNAEALFVLESPLIYRARREIAELALKQRLPTSFAFREYVDAGGLFSYGVSFPEMFRRIAEYVDKILKGAKPTDLPVEQPTSFELVINLKTAKALGLTIPQSLLLRADQVIE